MRDHRIKTTCASLILLLAASCQATFAEEPAPGTGVKPVPLDSYKEYHAGEQVTKTEKVKRKINRVLSMMGNLFLGMDSVHYQDSVGADSAQ